MLFATFFAAYYWKTVRFPVDFSCEHCIVNFIINMIRKLIYSLKIRG